MDGTHSTIDNRIRIGNSTISGVPSAVQSRGTPLLEAIKKETNICCSCNVSSVKHG